MNANTGLTSIEAYEKLKQFGLNEIKSNNKISPIKIFLKGFSDLMVLILIGASLIAIYSGEYIDGYVILFIVFLNAIIGFIQEYKADKAIEALQKLVAPKSRVLRDNTEIMIESNQIVPGDILILNEGDKVTADGQLVESYNLHINESILTGESVPVEKSTDLKGSEKNIVFMGTEVTKGTGIVLVTETGMQSKFGLIAKLTTETNKDKSPLQKELLSIGVFVSKITFVICFVLFLVIYFIEGKTFLDTLLFAVSVAVAAVPEGLPATITIALALGVQKLAKKNTIVKQLSSVETLGSTTVICSDKTGTLTENQMSVELYRSWSNEEEDNEIALKTMYLCQNAKKSIDKYVGDPTEIALLKYANEKSAFYEGINFANYQKIYEIPFDSERKMMSVIIEEKHSKKKFIFTKGASEKILEICSLIRENGKTVKIDATHKKKILEEIEAMSNKALRVLAIAYSEEENAISNENNLIFIGLVGIIDPPRKEVPEAIRKAKAAGIKIHIITGDHPLTAKAIGDKIGLNAKKLLTGAELNDVSDKELQELLKTNDSIIFARVNPEDKLRVTNALKENKEVVAVTGDGVNDAPALKRADIGIAMGITGTDVSKEAANMVLADDSFASIVTAIEEGRKIYENLKKFVFYIFSSNIGELTAIILAILLQIPAPLTAILILSVNLGTDVLPAVALGVENVEDGIMHKSPRKPNSKIITKQFMFHFVWLGALIGLLVLAAYFVTLNAYGWSFGSHIAENSIVYLKASTVAFVMLVMVQMVNAINCRSLEHSIFKVGFFGNRHLIGAIIISIIFAVSVVQIPFLQQFFGTTFLSLKEWLFVTLASCLIFVVEEIRKAFQKRTV